MISPFAFTRLSIPNVLDAVWRQGTLFYTEPAKGKHAVYKCGKTALAAEASGVETPSVPMTIRHG